MYYVLYVCMYIILCGTSIYGAVSMGDLRARLSLLISGCYLTRFWVRDGVAGQAVDGLGSCCFVV